ncbi:MAG: S41 family peptidase [Bacteroidales bacterium]|nr:S41 family peptidase [Bacteroidales bacterium]MDD4217957.1 S41 family peptidase [Bacteroidales bacterium]MDY0144164.1 S41 family peptidase [Bacteroidales bacterium]
MKSKNIIYIFLAVLTFIVYFSSCEKMAFEKEIDNTPIENYDYLWNEVNEKYAFLEYKNVNWDSIYEVYLPHINSKMTNDSLFRVLGNMLNELRDGHVNLFSPFNLSRYDITLLGPVNINTRIIKDNYLGTDYYTTGSFVHNFINNGDIGYIRYSSFANSLITDYELDFILERYENTQGLILDIRQNGGGYVDNVQKLLSLFCNDERLLYETQIKNGPNANNFTLLESAYSNKTERDIYDKKIIVLTDRGSYSASSFFSVCTYAFDNVILVGDTTGGGLGLPNGGQLPNGWTYRFSITQTIAVNGQNYENGVPPNHTVILSDDAAETGIDNVIEFAVNLIKS